MISEIDHVAITVSDINESLAFYRDIMGMEVMIDAELVGKEVEAVLALPGAKLRTVVLKKGERAKGMVELLSFSSPEGDSIPVKRRPSDVGPYLLSFEVDDIEKEYQRLLKKGVKFNSPPQPLNIKPAGIFKAAIFQGPDGILLELVERPPEMREV